MLQLSTTAQMQSRHLSGGPREYENRILEKLKPYENIPGFHGSWGNATQWAIDHHCGDDLNGITARDFLNRILNYPDDVLEIRILSCSEAWLKRNEENINEKEC